MSFARRVLMVAFGVVTTACGAGTSSDPTSDSGSTEVRQVWARYTACEISRDFRPCYVLLSAERRRWWNEHGGSTPEAYYDVKGSEEIAFRDFNLVTIRESLGATSVVADASTSGEADERRVRREYRFVKEPGGWKIVTIQEGGRDFAP